MRYGLAPRAQLDENIERAVVGSDLPGDDLDVPVRLGCGAG